MRYIRKTCLILGACVALGACSSDSVKLGDSGRSDTSETGNDTEEVETGETAPEELDCVDDLIFAPEWFDGEPVGTLAGGWEFGQTHVTGSNETRRAPPVVAEKETLVLFTPTGGLELDPDAEVLLSVWQDEQRVGVMRVSPPGSLPSIQEQGLTTVELEPYSSEAWSATLPWNWVQEGAELRIGTEHEGGLVQAVHVFEDLGAPHAFTVTRSKIVLFGDESLNTDTVSIERLARDYGGVLPASEIHVVDSTDWVLDEMVVSTSEGYRMVQSEAERLAVTNESNRWSLLKHQFALRMSVANTGRGLVVNQGWEGDSSPYSFGTSVVLGWVVDENGYASDIDNAGVAAGWTGWSAIWAWECGNAFTHELGHSQTLYHFTGGTAASWGIGEEYPNDGQNMSFHPWGYDTARRQFRTWYQVGSGGPTEGSDEGKYGKRDPMNGGEGANAVNCFPQYTGYHAEKIQNWYEASPTIREVEGEDGVYIWNDQTHSYDPYEVSSNHQEPVAIGVPTVTLIGTLGGLDEDTRQTYPPLYSVSGNVFDMPDPADSGHDAEFDGAKWFLEIHYADGSEDRALIAVGDLAETSLMVYALNLDARRSPTRVDLYQTQEGYPNMDLGSATLVHSRSLAVPDGDTLPPVVSVGKGKVANGSLTLSKWCTQDVDCATREVLSTWREAEQSITFADRSGVIPDPDDCLERGTYSTIGVPIRSEDGQTATLFVKAQKELETGSERIILPQNDRTPWIEAADLSQSLRLWVPYAENAGLAAGTWHTDGDYVLDVLMDGQAVGEVPIHVDLIVDEPIDAEITADGFWDIAISQEGSAVYYVVEDSNMGPTWRVWWDDGVAGAPVLSVPVVDQDTGALTTLYLDAYKVTAGYWWDFNTAQWAEHGVYDNYLALYPNGTLNGHLEPSHSYQSPGSSLLVIKGYGWHSGTDLGRFPLHIRYTAP